MDQPQSPGDGCGSCLVTVLSFTAIGVILALFFVSPLLAIGAGLVIAVVAALAVFAWKAASKANG
jgi:hypothetical protein